MFGFFYSELLRTFYDLAYNLKNIKVKEFFKISILRSYFVIFNALSQFHIFYSFLKSSGYTLVS